VQTRTGKKAPHWSSVLIHQRTIALGFSPSVQTRLMASAGSGRAVSTTARRASHRRLAIFTIPTRTAVLDGRTSHMRREGCIPAIAG
jgi:hypothetical protein